MTDSQASTSPDGSRRQANEFPSPAGSSRPDQGSATKNLPVLLQEAEGNLEWKEGEFDKNAAGVASIAVAAIDGLNLLVKSGGKLNERDFNLIKELVDFIPQETIDSFFQELTSSVPPQSGGLLPVKQRTRPLRSSASYPPMRRLTMMVAFLSMLYQMSLIRIPMPPARLPQPQSSRRVAKTPQVKLTTNHPTAFDAPDENEHISVPEIAASGEETRKKVMVMVTAPRPPGVCW